MTAAASRSGAPGGPARQAPGGTVEHVAPRRIDLADCEVAILSLRGAHRRSGVVAGLCDRLGLPWTLVDAVECTPTALGCGLSHVKALRGWEGDRPLLVLEDDVAATGHFRRFIDLPADADAAWLGLSVYGAAETIDYVGFTHLYAAEPVDEGLARIHNMLAAHAVLHISREWREAAIDAMLHAMLEALRPPDCGLARIQGHFRVYAPIHPFFYQAAELQPPEIAGLREEATRIALPILPEGSVCELDLAEGKHSVRLERVGERLAWLDC